MNAEQKLVMIGDLCRHPGAFHWSGRQMADAIRRILARDEPIGFDLSDLDRPIPYELVHDAVSEEVDDDDSSAP